MSSEVHDPDPEPAEKGSEVPPGAPEGGRVAASAGQTSAAAVVIGGKPSDASPEAMSHPLVQDLLLNPAKWRIWPALAVLRWLLRRSSGGARSIMFRSKPSLNFPTSEIDDVAIDGGRIELTLNAPGLAATGTPLPTADIERIIHDRRDGGGLGYWLDGTGDRFMHALEAAFARNNAEFALATGGRIEALNAVSSVVGKSAPLAAQKGGVLADTERHEPLGAVGLCALFLGPVSASGLVAVMRAFTELPVRITEFAGAKVLTLRPARLGRRIGNILGAQCWVPAAGIEIQINGGHNPEALQWARDPVRRSALRMLAVAYIGSTQPAARLYLRLEPGNVPPAAFDGGTVLGGLAVLGNPSEAVRVPLQI